MDDFRWGFAVIVVLTFAVGLWALFRIDKDMKQPGLTVGRAAIDVLAGTLVFYGLSIASGAIGTNVVSMEVRHPTFWLIPIGLVLYAARLLHQQRKKSAAS